MPLPSPFRCLVWLSGVRDGTDCSTAKELLSLAERVRPHDAHAAGELEQVAGEAIRVLVRRDERWLRRKFDPAALVGTLMLAAPGVAAGILGWQWDSGWKWSVVVLGVLWVLIVLAAGWQQVLTTGDDADDRA